MIHTVLTVQLVLNGLNNQNIFIQLASKPEIIRRNIFLDVKRQQPRKKKKEGGKQEKQCYQKGIVINREAGLSSCLIKTSNLVPRTNLNNGNYYVTLGKLFSIYWFLFLTL